MVSSNIVLALGLLSTAYGAEIWPMPQTFSTTSNGAVAYLDPSKFSFSCAGACGSEISEAFSRYHDLIFLGPHPSTVPSGASTIESLSVSVKQSAKLDLGMDESYTLTVTPDKAATLTANTQFGALRGLESFSQLVSWSLGTLNLDQYSIDSLPIHVVDNPRFQWRGLLIDSSRHFLTVTAILRTLDAMSYNKYNVLHWHIIDDQSWPLITSTMPNCTINGAYAPEATYSHADVKRIVDYAAARGIRVLVEFDVPAHADVWGKCSPNLVISCPNGQTLVDPTGPVYTALDGLLTEFSSIFTDDFLHLGGDEVENLICWEQSSKVQSFMKANGLATVHDMRNYFELEVQSIARKHKRTPIVWEEVFDKGYSLNTSTIVNIWLSGAETKKVIEAGNRVINNYGWYLDQQVPPGGTHYLWEDTWINFYLNDPLVSAGLTPEQEKMVLGGEASQWGEQVDALAIDVRIWPRASATAERLWSAADVNDVATAKLRLSHFRCKMAQRGIHASPIQPASECGYCRLPYDH